MFQNLTGLAWGLVAFAIIIGVGAIVLSRFGAATAECATGFEFNETESYCQNATNISSHNTNYGTTTSNMLFLNAQLGEGGLAGWAPAVIALSIGLLFLGAFMMKGGKDGY
jgi:high-affinity Fe2+/Pb2+ permease